MAHLTGQKRTRVTTR